MSSRRPIVCLLWAVLLSCGLGRAGAKPPNRPADAPALMQRVYSVADLVIPVGDAGDTAGPKATQEEKLMALIRGTVAARSWEEMGGPGTIDFFPMTLSLVINQTLDVHEQIDHLLAALRRLQDEEVAVEIRLATVADKVFREHLSGLPGLAFLGDKQVSRLMDAIQGDARTNVMQAPKVTAFNGQTAAFNVIDEQFFVTGLELTAHEGALQVCPKPEVIPLGLQVSLRPVLAADRRSVELTLDMKQTELASSVIPLYPVTVPLTPVNPDGGDVKPAAFTQYIQQPKLNKLALKRTLKIPDGQTAVLTGWEKQCEVTGQGPSLVDNIPILNQWAPARRLSTWAGRHCETRHVLVMVTPRILVREEEERRPQAPPCRKAKGAAKARCVPPSSAPASCATGRMEEQDCVKNDCRTPIIGPIHEGEKAQCGDAPDEARILRALEPLGRVPGLFEESRDNIQIVTERIVDKVDPPRFFPLVGPARLHHSHWKCTVYCTETVAGSYPFPFRLRRPRVDVVYIDEDHLHLCGE